LTDPSQPGSQGVSLVAGCAVGVSGIGNECGGARRVCEGCEDGAIRLLEPGLVACGEVTDDCREGGSELVEELGLRFGLGAPLLGETGCVGPAHGRKVVLLMQAAEFGGQLGRSAGERGLREPVALTEFNDPVLGRGRALLELVSLNERGLVSKLGVQELNVPAKGSGRTGEWS
jgi:hypothetical protein